MAFSTAAFNDDTDFERLILDRLGTHRIQRQRPASVHDIRGGGSIIALAGTSRSGTRALEELRQSLRPVGFGAAYKVLDILIEHVLLSNGLTGRLTFSAKQRRLAQRPATLPPPFDGHPELWDRIALLYLAFQETRHAVTHRRAQATAGGDLEVYDDARQLIDTVSNAEIAYFAGAVHAIAEMVIDATSDGRRVRSVAHFLNGLATRHGLSALTAQDADAGRSVLQGDLIALDDERLRFDVARARRAVGGQPPEMLWDLELYAGARKFVGRWEDVPDSDTAAVLEFHPASPPMWLNEELP